MKKAIRRFVYKATVPVITVLTLIALVTLVSGHAHAKTKTAAAIKKSADTKSPRQIATENLGETGQLLANYLGCARPLRQESDVEALRACVVPQLYAGADRSRQDRFVSWLMLNPQIDEIRRCEDHDLQAAEYFTERTFNHLCFQFRMNGQTRVGVAFFKGGKGAKSRLGLFSIFY